MRQMALVLLLAVAAVACTGTPGGSPSQTQPPPATVQPTIPVAATPAPSPSAGSDFYLRGWHVQALPPTETFTWLPMVTVADGVLIDGNVAVPAIYPGQLMVSPFARPISEEGGAAIVEEARRLGLLDGESDFTGGAVMPGSRTAQLEMIIEGTTYSLTGVPDLSVDCDETGHCDAEPGTPAAFTAFWRELEMSQMWLEAELGPPAPYDPERVVLLLGQPPAAEPGMELTPVAWPYETPIAEAGVEFPGGVGERCVTLVGDALDVALPALQTGTQLTVFVDEDGTQAAPIVRVLVPGEPSPCPDDAATDS